MAVDYREQGPLPESKTCSGCKLHLLADQFYVTSRGRVRRRDGQRCKALSTLCRKCAAADNKSRQQKRRQIVASLKTDRGCVDCGYNAHPEALEFDHLPEFHKSFDISQGLRTRGLDAILAEIEKCEVVCGNCHAVRTANRRLLPV